MTRETDSRTKRKFFDLSLLPASCLSLAPAYVRYVLFRAANFGPNFPETRFLALPADLPPVEHSQAQALEGKLQTLVRLAAEVELDDEEAEVTKVRTHDMKQGLHARAVWE
jgi:hypothetical protein